MIDSLLGSATDAISSVLSAAADVIGDTILNALNNFIGNLLYYLDWASCAILHLVYNFFGIFAGISRVTYKGEEDYLINVFFSNSSITNIYWAMAMIGIILAVGFTIFGVIKKMFDMSDQERRSIGDILWSLLKAVALIAAMNFILVVTLNMTNLLLQRVNYAFDNAESLDDPQTIVYTSDQYVYMNDIFEIIGTYAMNPSYTSRYNINSCYNAIRSDLQVLENTGMFRAYYDTQRTVTVNGQKQVVTVDTWQSVLQEIDRAASPSSEVAVDVYHEALSKAILHAMEVLRTNSNFQPLQYYEAKYTGVENADLDVVIFMAGTGTSAKNSEYNTNVSLTDALRGAYVYGEKSIYDKSDVTADFDIGLFGGINHLLILVLCILITKELILISLAAVVRIFSMLLLYLISPPVIAVMPYDNGEKFKQWVTAFVVQAFGLFGTVIAMRLLILFIPIILSSDLVLLENPVMNLAAKAFLIYGGVVAAERASGMVTGILSGNAGWQAVQAGDVRREGEQMMKQTGLDGLGAAGISGTVGTVKTLGGGAMKFGKWAYRKATGGDGTGRDGTGGGTPVSASLGGDKDKGTGASGDKTPDGSPPSSSSLGGTTDGGNTPGSDNTPSGGNLGGGQDSGNPTNQSVQNQGNITMGNEISNNSNLGGAQGSVNSTNQSVQTQGSTTKGNGIPSQGNLGNSMDKNNSPAMGQTGQNQGVNPTTQTNNFQNINPTSPNTKNDTVNIPNNETSTLQNPSQSKTVNTNGMPNRNTLDNLLTNPQNQNQGQNQSNDLPGKGNF